MSEAKSTDTGEGKRGSGRVHPISIDALIVHKYSGSDILLQKADKIFIEELHNFKIYNDVWQAFAVLLPIQSVGVQGDFRTYDRAIALRAVTSTDGMTADWARLPFEFLQKVSSRITSEIRGINRVVYDISSKPPSTIEWE